MYSMLLECAKMTNNSSITEPLELKCHNRPGELYIIQTRNCIESHPTVFKAGRAHNVFKRLEHYPKGSLLVARVPVSMMVDAENLMLKLLRMTFTQRKDFGNEYFEGSVRELMAAMLSAAAFFPVISDALLDVRTVSDQTSCDKEMLHEATISPHTPSIQPDVSFNNLKPHTSRDPTALLIQYINTHRCEFAGYVDSVMLLETITSMYRDAGCSASPTLRSMLRDLKHYYKCTEFPQHTFSEGNIRHAICFANDNPGTRPPHKPVNHTLKDFFEMNNKPNYSIECVEGEITYEPEFRAAFEIAFPNNCFRPKYIADAAVFAAHGYRFAIDNICKSCNMLATGRPNLCCDQYNALNRVKKYRIHNMRLTKISQPSEMLVKPGL